MLRKVDLLIIIAMMSVIESFVSATEGDVPDAFLAGENIASHSLVFLTPAIEGSIDCEDLAPPFQLFSEFLSNILEADVSGKYTDLLGQVWNVSDYNAFIQFVGNRHAHALSSDFVRPVGVYTYLETGLISVIYDFVKDGEAFFSLELTRIPEAYRIAREEENKVFRALREQQDREYAEILEKDRQHQAEQMEVAKMGIEDELSRLCFYVPPKPRFVSSEPLTREQLRAHNAARYAQIFSAKKNDEN